jgi:hypothetical protein
MLCLGGRRGGEEGEGGGKRGGEGRGARGEGRTSGGGAHVRAFTRRLTCPLLPDVNCPLCQLPEVRGRACAQAASASYASYFSDSIYTFGLRTLFQRI